MKNHESFFGVFLRKTKGSKILLCTLVSSRTEMLEDGLTTKIKWLCCLSASHTAPADVHSDWGFVGGTEFEEITKRLAIMN